MAQSNLPHALTRNFRLALSSLEARDGGSNGLLGGGGTVGVGAIGELEVTVVGIPSPTGYLLDITVLDAALRRTATPRFCAAVRTEAATGKPTDLVQLLQEVAAATAVELPVTVASLAYRPSPFRSVAVTLNTLLQDNAMDTHSPPTQGVGALLSETFEFAAAHRLHLATLSDEENRRLFGKCNNLHGHGHNYRIEVAVAVPTDDSGSFGFAALQEVVQREIMDRFDHKHLNIDCPEFRTLNPSVENIAKVCHDLLVGPLAKRGGALRFVRVWETDKTSCQYPA